jgi:DNA modification methylase
MKPYYEEAGITIYHGDCREMLPTLPDASVDFVFTDPPYGHNNNEDGDLIHRWEAALGRLPSGAESPAGRPIANDGRAQADELVQWAFAEWARLLMPGCCCCCCCGGGGPDPQFARWSLWLDAAIGFKQMVVWDKGPMGMGWHYRRSYETVLVGEKPGAACRWFDKTDRIENIIRPIRKIIPSAHDHPTPKPAALAAHFIGFHTAPGDLVLDCFMGGGSTLQAARQGQRRAIGVEIEERWCEAAAKSLGQSVFEFEPPRPATDEQMALFGWQDTLKEEAVTRMGRAYRPPTVAR